MGGRKVEEHSISPDVAPALHQTAYDRLKAQAKSFESSIKLMKKRFKRSKNEWKALFVKRQRNYYFKVREKKRL